MGHRAMATIPWLGHGTCCQNRLEKGREDENTTVLMKFPFCLSLVFSDRL